MERTSQGGNQLSNTWGLLVGQHHLKVATGEFHRLGRCFVDWATAVVGEGDTCQLSVSLPYHSSGPIYETLAQSTEFDGSTHNLL